MTKAFDWHIEGEILNPDYEPLKVDDDYVDKMRKDLETEKVHLEEKKKVKLAALKEKKKEIMNKLYEDKPASSTPSTEKTEVKEAAKTVLP